MLHLNVIFTFLSWEAKEQIRCFPTIPINASEPVFTIDNPLLRVSKIVHDIHFPREGETQQELCERQGLITPIDPERIKAVHIALEAVHVMLHLMWASNQDILLTQQGLESAREWRVVRRLSDGGKAQLPIANNLFGVSVDEVILNYDLSRRD